MEQFRGIPYGISNFKQLRRENLYYVDKSQYISKLEQTGHFLFFIRPRRFGKNLFLNMLCAYYDMNEAEAQKQWDEAVEQIRQYAEGPKVQLIIQHTQLHLIVVQIRDYKLEKMEEIF